MMFKTRWRASTLCLLAVVTIVVILLLNTLDFPFSQLDKGFRLERDPIPSSSVSVPVIIPEVEVYTFQEVTSWTRETNICASIDNQIYHGDFFRVPLESQVGSLSVFIHNPTKDGLSGKIYKERRWEPNILNVILLFLRTDDDTNFIDIGANIGLHGLQIAKYGRKVLALEASKHNVQHICASTHYGRFHDYVKVVYNAAGKNHETSNIILGGWGDLAGNFVNISNTRKQKFKTDGKFAYKDTTVSVPTVTLDDLLSWQHFEIYKKSFIKMDVEGSEHLVMEGAKRFMQNSNIKGIIMEWKWHKGQSSAETILDIMKSCKFQPFDFSNTKITRKKFFSQDNLTKLFRSLNPNESSSWPANVLWAPMS
ncbi:uncharacterized protein LOC132565309 [Ylistrum balloti]|uniref:uncharacterized protein LOC132565309 n=1 Tax=Ylistrum balloti TaxID=509963 RepID=UPI002905C748|nr:uncharacterized protein LOC132565309 [Ylistrum balloti]